MSMFLGIENIKIAGIEVEGQWESPAGTKEEMLTKREAPYFLLGFIRDVDTIVWLDHEQVAWTGGTQAVYAGRGEDGNENPIGIFISGREVQQLAEMMKCMEENVSLDDFIPEV